ncbi:hypothetical protein [Gluconobacter japonicus]|uniref:hypothetical protein n=1 Tax=Gluconobacter japonicus TaxID=376620 RepID=UPI001B8A915B|nr:hypothetical protein [Gluconobacter japonicus]MBS1050246.1 hypothetical protein [Gluconobacter japonicus]
MIDDTNKKICTAEEIIDFYEKYIVEVEYRYGIRIDKSKFYNDVKSNIAII